MNPDHSMDFARFEHRVVLQYKIFHRVSFGKTKMYMGGITNGLYPRNGNPNFFLLDHHPRR